MILRVTWMFVTFMQWVLKPSEQLNETEKNSFKTVLKLLLGFSFISMCEQQFKAWRTFVQVGHCRRLVGLWRWAPELPTWRTRPRRRATSGSELFPWDGVPHRWCWGHTVTAESTRRRHCSRWTRWQWSSPTSTSAYATVTGQFAPTSQLAISQLAEMCDGKYGVNNRSKCDF